MYQLIFCFDWFCLLDFVLYINIFYYSFLSFNQNLCGCLLFELVPYRLFSMCKYWRI